MIAAKHNKMLHAHADIGDTLLAPQKRARAASESISHLDLSMAGRRRRASRHFTHAHAVPQAA